MEVSFTLADKLDPIAIYAALVASVVLVWDIIKWARKGPKLKLHVIVPAKIVNPDDEDGEGTYAFVTVTNVGTFPTTITHLGMAYYQSWWKAKMDIVTKEMYVVDPDVAEGGRPLPAELQFGKQWTGGIRYKEEVKRMVRDGYLFFCVYHSLGNRPKMVRIQERRHRRAG
jgi:hypothetical protein